MKSNHCQATQRKLNFSRTMEWRVGSWVAELAQKRACWKRSVVIAVIQSMYTLNWKQFFTSKHGTPDHEQKCIYNDFRMYQMLPTWSCLICARLTEATCISSHSSCKHPTSRTWNQTTQCISTLFCRLLYIYTPLLVILATSESLQSKTLETQKKNFRWCCHFKIHKAWILSKRCVPSF